MALLEQPILKQCFKHFKHVFKYIKHGKIISNVNLLLVKNFLLLGSQ